MASWLNWTGGRTSLIGGPPAIYDHVVGQRLLIGGEVQQALERRPLARVGLQMLAPVFERLLGEGGDLLAGDVDEAALGVAAHRMLDLDDVRAPVGEHRSSRRHEGELRHFEDPNALHHLRHRIDSVLKRGPRPAAPVPYETPLLIARAGSSSYAAETVQDIAETIRRRRHPHTADGRRTLRP